MTTITNAESASVTTMEQVQAWMTSNSIPITGSISLAIDSMGFVESLITAVTLTTPQITSFKENFFNKRAQGNKGSDIVSAGTITLTQGNLVVITGTTTINYITTTGWKPGSMICLEFIAGPITLNHNTSSVPANTAALFLNSNSNFSFKAGSVLTVIYDGTYWREIARMESSP